MSETDSEGFVELCLNADAPLVGFMVVLFVGTIRGTAAGKLS